MSVTYVLRDLHGHQMAETEAAHIERAMEYFESLGYPTYGSAQVGIKQPEISYTDEWDNWHPSYDFTPATLEPQSITDMPVAGSTVNHIVHDTTQSFDIGASGAFNEPELRHSEK